MADPAWITRGIGAGIALQLARRGANLVVNYVSESSMQRAEKIVEQIQQETGTKAILCQASVMNLEEIPRLIEAALAISRDGKIDILIHKYA
jgi:NAD(P)-dependent dehydrogenase (short-subunit alcohol dehydrogenase family)